MNRSRPQRVMPPVRPGELLKQLLVPPRAPAAAPDHDPDYLALVRACPCLRCGQDPSGEAAHVRYASAAFGKASGMGKKPQDRHAVPLCREDHLTGRDAQHRRGEAQFWVTLGINPLLVAQRLYEKRGDLVAMRAVIFVAIAERGS